MNLFLLVLSCDKEGVEDIWEVLFGWLLLNILEGEDDFFGGEWGKFEIVFFGVVYFIDYLDCEK